MTITCNGEPVRTEARAIADLLHERLGDPRPPGVAVAGQRRGGAARRVGRAAARRRRCRREVVNGGAGRMTGLVIAGETLSSRLFLGTGGLPNVRARRPGARRGGARPW
jgi:hypothetical protein